ncbi:MAG TPA: preprotein translocase subunit SecE [Candidatus Dojkabacteria bacterium]|uniref:Preprotein translocase subunit SecE n=1 Tax=Candidatus Dojkabacteria bacterium TaxID=2099670 RepID=A0A847D0Q7_9BACT|nr:preprotein translocase subunit SecE [Candidatus Dojkabacteria bacterium]HNW33076.1 preprotein translocase subunit SecE [Candidatus Dojkabacteria bacterium]HOZ44772.1 preprotein translocase subunit SecE [Candidatus Dojkabacteria bacterium]HPR91873.1 preprotein translocase subunit SecE [Candidatus Dojkabacteria bacterium]
MKFFKNIVNELKNTTWPNRKDILNMTLYVLAIAGILTIVMLSLDLGFAEVRDWFLNI